jgi:hypothetical protein
MEELKLDVSDEGKLEIVTDFIDKYGHAIGALGCVLPLTLMDALEKLTKDDLLTDDQYAQYFGPTEALLTAWSELLTHYGRNLHQVSIMLGIVSDEEMRERLDNTPIPDEMKQEIINELFGDAHRTED